MPQDALVIQLPTERQARTSARIPDLPFTQARVDKNERTRTGGRWGDVSASAVTGVLNRAAQGDISDWIDLCEHFIATDADLGSLYDTRVTRVQQADFIICPNQFGNPATAKLAAEFVNELMGRIEDWHQATRDLLHAIAVGFAAGENEWDHDRVTSTNYVRKIHFRHGHRFRYDESWQPRLYDQGRKRSPASMYGEALDPRLWTVHQYRLFAHYPGAAGLMRNSIFPVLFGRWVDKFWIANAEKHGDPLVYATVLPNTPEPTRNKLLADLERLSNDHVGVLEQGGTITVDAAAAAAKSYEGYKDYLAYKSSLLGKLWLGSSDIADPGAHGSQAAVGTRAAVTTDPRMVVDGDGFAASLQRTLFKYMLLLNPHKFGCPIEQVPVPTMKLKTADDEVGGDRGDKLIEQQAERQGYTQEIGADGKVKPAVMLPAPGGPPRPQAAKPQPEIAITMSHGELLEIVKASTAGAIGQDAAYEMIVAGGVESARAMRMVGLPQEPTFVASTGEPPPKALAPAGTGLPTTKSRPTTSRSVSPFARTLRRGSGESASSSSKRQLKLPQP